MIQSEFFEHFQYKHYWLENLLGSSYYLTTTPEWRIFRKEFWKKINYIKRVHGVNLKKCTYCGWHHNQDNNNDKRYYNLDHIIPFNIAPLLALDSKNIAISCNVCNKEKGSKYKDKELSTNIINLQEFVAKECEFK